MLAGATPGIGSLDDTLLSCKVTSLEPDDRVRAAPPLAEGVLVRGLALHGAQWLRGDRQLGEAAPKQVGAPFPLLQIAAVSSKVAKARVRQWGGCVCQDVAWIVVTTLPGVPLALSPCFHFNFHQLPSLVCVCVCAAAGGPGSLHVLCPAVLQGPRPRHPQPPLHRQRRVQGCARGSLGHAGHRVAV